MKFPKKILIAGKTYKIITDKKIRGGWFDSQDQIICVGLKNCTSELKKCTFLHEVIESILTERLLRYKKPYENNDNGHYIFVFNHQEFENAIWDLTLALKDVLKI